MTLLTAVRSGKRERLAAGAVGEERSWSTGRTPWMAAAAAEDRGDVAFAAAVVERVDHEFGDAAVGGEVAVDEFGGFFLRDAQAFGEAEGALAVDDAEVDGFGAAALGGSDFVERNAEDLAGDDGCGCLRRARRRRTSLRLRSSGRGCGARFANSRRRAASSRARRR